MVTVGIFPFQENSHGRAGNRTRDLMISSHETLTTRPRGWSHLILLTVFIPVTKLMAIPSPFLSTQNGPHKNTNCFCTSHFNQVKFHSNFSSHISHGTYSRTPLIRTLVIQIADYPDRLGPSGKSVKNSTELSCLEITGYRIKYSTVLWLLELQIRRGQKV